MGKLIISISPGGPADAMSTGRMQNDLLVVGECRRVPRQNSGLPVITSGQMLGLAKYEVNDLNDVQNNRKAYKKGDCGCKTEFSSAGPSNGAVCQRVAPSPPFVAFQVPLTWQKARIPALEWTEDL
jgi:hypothetical protein